MTPAAKCSPADNVWSRYRKNDVELGPVTVTVTLIVTVTCALTRSRGSFAGIQEKKIRSIKDLLSQAAFLEHCDSLALLIKIVS